jgi:hypothetical protein
VVARAFLEAARGIYSSTLGKQNVATILEKKIVNSKSTVVLTSTSRPLAILENSYDVKTSK